MSSLVVIDVLYLSHVITWTVFIVWGSYDALPLECQTNLATFALLIYGQFLLTIAHWFALCNSSKYFLNPRIYVGCKRPADCSRIRPPQSNVHRFPTFLLYCGVCSPRRFALLTVAL